MSKFCGNCGTQMEDNAVVCGNCGFSMSHSQLTFKPGNPEQEKIKKSKRKKIIGICAGVVAVALVAVICFNFIGGRNYKSVVDTDMESRNYKSVVDTDMEGRSYKSVVDTCMEASLKEPNAVAIMELFPNWFLSKRLEDENMSRTEFLERLQDNLDDFFEEIELSYDDWTVTWEIIDEYDASKSEVKYFSDDCEDLYNFKVSAGKELTVKADLEGIADGETVSETTYNYCLRLVKSGKSWYLLDFQEVLHG